MNPQRLLKKLTIITVVSLINILFSLILYQAQNLLSIIPIITALLNCWILLKYFAYTIQHILAHRIAKRHPVDHYFAINIILGIIVNALLIYGLFVMIIAHTLVIIEFW